VLLRQLATPPLMMAPSKIGLILSDSEALISWKAPISMPFQASGNAWRSLSYEFILLGGMPFESAVDLMANASATDSSVTMSTATAQIIAQSSIQQDHHLVQINSGWGNIWHIVYLSNFNWSKTAKKQVSNIESKLQLNLYPRRRIN
jgi:hypothetical protein